jgi:excisionase family DNA binding protein
MLGLVSIIIPFVQHQPRHQETAGPRQVGAVGVGRTTDHHSGPGAAARGPPHERDAPWQPQPSPKAATTAPSYLRAAEVADLLHVSPKTVSRWAKEGKLPFLKTLGGHRRYPEAEIRQLAEGLREEATA